MDGLVILIVGILVLLLIGWKWINHKDWQMKIVGWVMVVGVLWNFIDGWSYK